MRILAFSDLHCDLAAAQRIARLATEADVLVGAGDFANARQGLHICLDVLRHITRPVVLVAGNNETHDELTKACSTWTSAHVLHGSSTTIAGITFFGLGGGVPETPFGSWSFDLTEDAAAALLAPCPIGAVLVSHSPPKGCCDLSSRGQSLGSRAVLDAVKRYRPELVICGHIHGSAGQQSTLSTTPVINAGPAGMITQVKGLSAFSPEN